MESSVQAEEVGRPPIKVSIPLTDEIRAIISQCRKEEEERKKRAINGIFPKMKLKKIAQEGWTGPDHSNKQTKKKRRKQKEKRRDGRGITNNHKTTCVPVASDAVQEPDYRTVNGKRHMSIRMKMNALLRLDRGEAVRRVATEMGVGLSTVKDWRLCRSKIERLYSQL